MALVDAPARLQIPDASMAGPSQASRAAASITRPASAQVYPSATPLAAQPHNGAQSTSRKRASHNVTTTQPQQEEQVGYRDVYSHPAAVAYAAAHPRRQIPKFGPYLLLQTLGEGEFGKVKLGLHQQWGEEVAVKLIRRGNIDTAVRMSKVEREIEVLRTIKHPNIVRLYDVIETDKYIGIILEYASGGELFDHILAHRYLKEKDACKLFSQLISGVYYIHQKKIVHRDLKLENLLLDRHRNVIITDFGFANRFEHRADDLMQTSCGSPCYAAPELVISEGLYVGSAVDIWSCGVILYAMLAGYLPFDDDPANPDGDNINLLYRYIVNTPLTFPDYVSADARELLSLMLVPDPAHRADLPTIMAHRWLRPYAHLFERSVADLERLAMEQHQQKRMAYQRQMKQQALAAAAEQSKLQRSQSARTDVPQIPAHISGSQRSRGQHPPSAMNADYLYDTSTNPDESLFTSPPPVPVTRASTGRRHVASAIVGASSPQAFEDDPFGPPPSRSGRTPQSTMSPEGEFVEEARGEPRSHRSRESSRTPKKQPSPVAVAPVKTSPERTRKADRQRHTIQLEYGGEPQQPTFEEPVRIAPAQPPTPRADEQLFVARSGSDDALDNGIGMAINNSQSPQVVVSDAINPESPVVLTPIEQRHELEKSHAESAASWSKATKPLPMPPTPPSNGTATPKRSSSIPTVKSQPEGVLTPSENFVKPPVLSITPTSPPRSENVPPPSTTAYEPSANGKYAGGAGSTHSGGSGSSKSKHRRGMSVDKLVGRLWGSSSDTEGTSFTNGVKARRPSDAAVTPSGSVRLPSDSLNIARPATLQISPSASPDSKLSVATDKSAISSQDEGKKSRRNTFTVMVEPLSKRISQRARGRQPAVDVVAAPIGNGRSEAAPPTVPAKTKADDEQPITPRFPPASRPTLPSAPIGAIPASTSKASKVMQWFRYRSKSRAPSESGQADNIGDDFDHIGHAEVDRSATPTAENPLPHVTVIEATPRNATGVPQAPSMGRVPPSYTSDTSVPPTPQASFLPRTKNMLSSIVATPAMNAWSGVAYNTKAIRPHHGAVDQTTVTTGSPPEVMAHVTKVLLDMGLEVQQENEFKLRCIRAKKKKVSSGSTPAGLTAFTMVGSAASNGVDKRGLPVPSQSAFSSTGGMLKGLLMRRQSSQVSAGSVSRTSLSFTGDSSIDHGRDRSESSINISREKFSDLPAPATQEPVYGDRTVDQGDEVRFSVELTRISGLEETFSLDIRRIKGHLRSYKFLYDTLRERCELPR